MNPIKLLPAVLRSAVPIALLLFPGDPAWTQQLGESGESELSFWRVLGALFLCLGLAVGAAFALRSKLYGRTPLRTQNGRRLRLIENLRLSHQTDLCLVEVDGHPVLLSVSASGVARIDTKLQSIPSVR